MDPQKYYEHLTPLYCRLIGHQWHLGYWVNASTLQEAISRITELMASRAELSSEMSVLDLGCGVGGTACWLAERFGCHVVGVSNSRAGLTEAERWTREQGLQERAGYQFADAAELPFDDDRFDAVWSCEAIHNVADQGAVMGELTRVVKPGGAVVIGDIFQLRNPTTRELVSQGLEEYGFHLRTAGQWVASLNGNGIRVRESLSIGHHVGEAVSQSARAFLKPKRKITPRGVSREACASARLPQPNGSASVSKPARSAGKSGQQCAGNRSSGFCVSS